MCLGKSRDVNCRFVSFPQFSSRGQKCSASTAKLRLHFTGKYWLFSAFLSSGESLRPRARCHSRFRAAQKEGYSLSSYNTTIFLDIQNIFFFPLLHLVTTLRWKYFIVRQVHFKISQLSPFVKNMTSHKSYLLKTDFCESPTTHELKH